LEYGFGMKLLRSVIVFDASDLDAESAFWAAVFNGFVLKDTEWHSVIDEFGEWRLGVQVNPTHVRPDWPNGVQQQQIHLDFHVDNQHEAHQFVIELGATLIQEAEDLDSAEGFQVYVDPAGHPFCLGWGQPTSVQLATFLKNSSQ
jgi:predicted enzyme related to lactoylglutathione lyase